MLYLLWSGQDLMSVKYFNVLAVHTALQATGIYKLVGKIEFTLQFFLDYLTYMIIRKTCC